MQSYQSFSNSLLIEKKTKVAAAEKFNVTPATVRKCVRRYVSEGESSVHDRSSRMHNETVAKYDRRKTLLKNIAELTA